MTGFSDRWWESRAFALAVIVLSAVPLLWPAVPPLTDVPGHMGSYRVMLGVDGTPLGQWFRFGWKPIGYLGGDLLIAALAPWMGLEPAVKAMMIAIPVLTVAGMLWISREVHGAVQPMALLALPFAYHFEFQLGFVNYTLAMALTLNAFALWLRLGRLGRFRLRAALFVPLAGAVWIAHLFGWLMLGVLAFGAEVVRAREAGRRWPAAVMSGIVACLPLAWPAALLVAWRPGDGHAGSDWLAGLRYKPGWLVMVLRDRWQWFDLGSLTLVALLLYRGIRSPDFRTAPALAAGCLGTLLLFVAMPFGSAYADARIAPYLWMLALLAVRVKAAAPARVAITLALMGMAFFVIRTAATTVSLQRESRSWTRHLAVLDHVPRGSRVASFVFASCDQPWARTRLTHLPSMAIVRRDAFTNDQFDLGGSTMLHVIAPGVRGFATDPSQIVTPVPCGDGEFRTLDSALRQFPRDRFDFVWLLDPPALAPVATAGLSPVWRQDGDLLLRIERAR